MRWSAAAAAISRDKKEVVPSDPIPSLALHRHARHRALHQEALDVPPFRSPKADFSTSGSMPRGTPQSLSSTEPAPRNGLSLARNGCSLSEASIPGSKVLTCYFATSQLVSPPGPPSAPPPSLVCPSRRQLRRFRPVAALLTGSLGCFLCLTPLQDFYLPRDRSVQQIPPPCGSPSEPARLPLAPRRRFYF